MLARRPVLILLSAIGISATAGTRLALAKTTHHMNGHKLLGDKIKQNGKHVIGKAGKNDVVAEVSNMKVVNMTDGNLPAHKVKSNRRMAALDDVNGIEPVADRTTVAQADTWYAYCFLDGTDEYCYWYPASDVVVTDGWTDYAPA